MPVTTGPEAMLVDPRTGLITRLVRHATDPDLPASWIGVSAHVADTRRFASWQADRHGFGAAFGDEDRARAAAVGEAVERYCGNVPPASAVTSSHADLVTAGHHAVDPAALALYDAEQHATTGFPFVPFTAELAVPWVVGTDLADGGATHVPASLVHLNHVPAPGSATNPLNYSGIATAATPEDADAAALEEVIERDATSIWWAATGPSIRVTGAGRVLGRLDDPHPEQRRITLLHIPSSFPVPVVGAFIEDDTDGIVAFGSACRWDPAVAAEKALVEAFGLLSITRQLARPDSDVWRAVAAGEIDAHTYAPFRGDRRYADSFRPDLRDVIDLPAIAQLYLDPRLQGEPLDRMRRADRTIDLDDLPRVGPAGRAARYVEVLASAGHRPVRVDLTTPDIAAAGLRVHRVVVPGLYGNAPPAYPYRGGRRLHDVPVALGWRAAGEPLPPVTHPLPLA